MPIKNFETEDFFAKYEFSKPYLISASDCETVSIDELIQLGGGSVKEFLDTKLGYPEMPGSHQLRKEITTLYKTVNEEQVLVLGSPIEGIYLTLNALIQKGDHVVVTSPAYDALYNVPEHVTGKVSRWFLKNDGQQWSLDFNELENLLKQNAKLLVINFPHNPTGFLPTKQELQKIVDLARQYRVRIFADEIYKGLEYNKADQLPSVADLDEAAVVLSGASKSMGLPGLRFGWLVTKDKKAYKALYDMKCYTSMCSTQAGEYLGRMAIRAGPKLVEKNLKIVSTNLAIAEKFFKKWNDRFQWLKPKAGSISLIKVNEKSAEQLCYDMADRFGVVLLPTRFMGYEDQYARVGFGRKNLEESLQVFDKALSEI